jgi:hypothetical protein
VSINTAGKNAALNALAALITHVSLHTGDPGGTGASEVTGGAYARKSVTWAAASAGAVAISGTPVFDVPAGTTITHVGLAGHLTASTFYGEADITDEAFGGAGTYTLTSLTITAT